MRPSVASIVFLTVSVCLTTPSVHAMTLAANGEARAVIATSTDAGPQERTAAAELQHYLSAVTGAEFRVQTGDAAPGGGEIVVRVGPPAKELAAEEWAIVADAGVLTIRGGEPRGTLYAVYHFLEDVVGVHWWNPWEESVPKRPTLTVPDSLHLSGRPTIRYRDIYTLWGNDEGRFAARNRLNRQGDAAIAPRYGGSRDYGPPYHVHTFYTYVPPDPYFAQHPEWFSQIGGKRTADQAQLCLTNPELRAFVIERLRGHIEASRAAAAAKGMPAPEVFSVSQNDWGGACQCDRCAAIVEREGSQAGPLLDFVNAIADAIQTDYPQVFIDTLAYTYTDVPPKTTRPRDNVIVRLCDTGSNFTQPITSKGNTAFRERLEAWARIARNLRVWDYAVTYAPYTGFPMPTVQTYRPDFRFYATHNVEGVFTELEYPILADLRDLKVWMMMKLLEDPERDDEELLATFTDGFHGPAGGRVREYLQMLERAAEAKPSYLSMGGGPRAARYLDLSFVRDAEALFDRAEAGLADVEDGATYLRRLRHARLPLDRAVVVLYPMLMTEWVQAGNDPTAMPLARDAIAARYADTWRTQANLRLPANEAAAECAAADREVAALIARKPYVPLPEQFRGLPAGEVFDFLPDVARNWMDIVKVVPDPEADAGCTLRLEFPPEVDAEHHPLEKYLLPMGWGVYDQAAKTNRAGGAIKPEDVPGPGYHWYKLGTTTVGSGCYLYFFWSWIIQIDLDAIATGAQADQSFAIWARVKYEGPSFPHGTPDQKDAICVERVVLVKTHG